MRVGPVLLVLLSAGLPVSASQGTVSAAVFEGGMGSLLDGKAFVVEKGEKGEKADGKDVYIFREGKFRSTYYEKHYGFGEGAYTAAKAGDAVTFATETNSKSNGTMNWRGTVTAEGIDVRYIWTGRKSWWSRADAKPVEHWSRSVAAWPTEDPGPPEGGTSHLLDGKMFLVQSGEQGKEASHHDDYLVFRNGLFVSSDCVELLDFRESTYSATPQGDGIRFRAETTSPKHGTMIWDGTVRGNVIDATARWIHNRWYWTIDRMYWFKGRLLE